MSNETHATPETLGLTAPVKLNEHHDLSPFDCGEPSVNDFAQKAHKQAKTRNAVIYVVCETGTNVVKGFYTLSNGSVARNEPPKSMQRFSMNEIPVTILGRLGVDKSYQGKGVGLDLLQDALQRAINAAEIIGSRAVLVHALNQKLADFYKKHAGFKESPITPLTLFMAL
jgi:GNAT superfamily N-acetyltransferase